MARKRLKLSDLQIDPSVLPRGERDQSLVTTYAEILRKEDMPDVVVFYDGSKYWLADGTHRHGGHEAIGEKQIWCDVRMGTRSDAIWFAAQANVAHGKRATTADKRRAVVNCLQDPDLRQQSNAIIAEQCGVSGANVGSVRTQLFPGQKDKPKTTKATTKAGKPVTSKPPPGAKAGSGSGKKSTAKKVAEATKSPKDGAGKPIPAWARPVFNDAVDLRGFQTSLGDVIKAAERLHARPSGVGALVASKVVAVHVQRIRLHIDAALPFAVCPKCRARGKPAKVCGVCNGRGWLTRAQYAVSGKG